MYTASLAIAMIDSHPRHLPPGRRSSRGTT